MINETKATSGTNKCFDEVSYVYRISQLELTGERILHQYVLVEKYDTRTSSIKFSVILRSQ